MWRSPPACPRYWLGGSCTFVPGTPVTQETQEKKKTESTKKRELGENGTRGKVDERLHMILVTGGLLKPQASRKVVRCNTTTVAVAAAACVTLQLPNFQELVLHIRVYIQR